MARPRWYEGQPPIHVVVPCTGARHRVTWDRGRLRLHDHDLAAERALIVLGGVPPACLALLLRFAWRPPPPAPRSHAMDDAIVPVDLLDVLRRTGRTRADRLDLRQEPPSSISMRRNRLERRLTETVVAAIRATIGAAVSREAARQVDVVVAPARGREPVSVGGVVRDSGGEIRVRLPLRWLFDVARRGLSLVDHAFVTEATWDHDSATMHVVALDWASVTATARIPILLPATATCAAGCWHLEWSDPDEAA